MDNRDPQPLNGLLAMSSTSLIKGPQLVGIIAGCLVFIVTICVVIYLLYMSGTFSKLMEELQDDAQRGTGKGKTVKGASKRGEYLLPQLSSVPELYDNLIQARQELSKIPNPPVLSGAPRSGVTVRQYEKNQDSAALAKACNGDALYHESDYDPARIWGWLDLQRTTAEEFDMAKFQGGSTNESPASASRSQFRSCVNHYFDLLYNSGDPRHGLHLVIEDAELDRQIGMITLADNSTENLSIAIENIWITPAFQGVKRSHHAMLLLLDWLFSKGYRRVVATTDERHSIGRRFLERCGMQCEAILRKHKVVHRRNRNTALYTILNSDWEEARIKLRRYLGLSEKAQRKVIDIEEFKVVSPDPNHSSGSGSAVGLYTAVSDGQNASKTEKKKNKRKKEKNGNKSK
jgi:RimJ/RimL family protein N-acetyltransferase